MKKYGKFFSIMAAAVLSLSIITGMTVYAFGTSAKALKTMDNQKVAEYCNTEDTDSSKIFTDCGEDMNKAEKIAGFNIELPALSQYDINAAEGVIKVDIICDDEGHKVTFAKFKNYSDVLDGYEEYQKPVINVDGYNITLYVYDGVIYAGFWEEGGYTYGVYGEPSITLKEISEYITEVADANIE